MVVRFLHVGKGNKCFQTNSDESLEQKEDTTPKAAKLREQLKQERELKKQEALKRSRQRRLLDPDYFQKKTEENAKIVEVKALEESSQSPSPALEDEEDKQTSSSLSDNTDTDDVFRAYKTSSRSTISRIESNRRWFCNYL